MSDFARQYAEGSRDEAPRIAYLESIRGFAALQVLLQHFLSAFAPALVFATPSGAIAARTIHLLPLHFLYDGYSAVYIFFTLSGYVLTRSFERHLAQPSSQIMVRLIRLGLPAIAATLLAAAVMLMFGRPNVEAGHLGGSVSFPSQWHADLSILSVIRAAMLNALFAAYPEFSRLPFPPPSHPPTDP